jgi:hypothetical protein
MREVDRKHYDDCEANSWATRKFPSASDYLESVLVRERQAVRRGGDFDRWDLEVRGGLLGYIRAIGMIEEHGAGKQAFRLRPGLTYLVRQLD